MIIREVKLNDTHAIYLLNKNGLGYDYPENKTKLKLEKIIANKNDKIYIAEINNIVVGYIQASAYECSYADSLKNILALVVDENYRRMGVGKELIKTIENWAKADNSSGIRLVSSSYRVDAHQFYLSCGYINKKEQKNFFKIF